MLLGDIHFTKVPLIGGEGTLRLSMEAQHALYFLTLKTVRWWWRKLVASALWSIWVAVGSAMNIPANSRCNFSFVGLFFYSTLGSLVQELHTEIFWWTYNNLWEQHRLVTNSIYDSFHISLPHSLGGSVSYTFYNRLVVWGGRVNTPVGLVS